MNIIDIVKCKLNVEHVCFSNDFYEQIFTSWYDVYSISKVEHAYDESLWHNRYITIGNKPVFYPEWAKKAFFLSRIS